jgi:hypothetical protein
MLMFSEFNGKHDAMSYLPANKHNPDRTPDVKSIPSGFDSWMRSGTGS